MVRAPATSNCGCYRVASGLTIPGARPNPSWQLPGFRAAATDVGAVGAGSSEVRPGVGGSRRNMRAPHSSPVALGNRFHAASRRNMRAPHRRERCEQVSIFRRARGGICALLTSRSMSLSPRIRSRTAEPNRMTWSGCRRSTTRSMTASRCSGLGRILTMVWCAPAPVAKSPRGPDGLAVRRGVGGAFPVQRAVAPAARWRMRRMPSATSRLTQERSGVGRPVHVDSGCGSGCAGGLGSSYHHL